MKVELGSEQKAVVKGPASVEGAAGSSMSPMKQASFWADLYERRGFAGVVAVLFCILVGNQELKYQSIMHYREHDLEAFQAELKSLREANAVLADRVQDRQDKKEEREDRLREKMFHNLSIIALDIKILLKAHNLLQMREKK